MTVEQRLERLERENRWMRRVAACVVAGVAVALLVAQGGGKAPPHLDVSSLTVKDDAGRDRILLGTVKDAAGRNGPGVHVLDPSGIERVALGVRSDGAPVVQLWDSSEKTGVLLVVGADGSRTLSLMDSSARTRAWLGVDAGDSPHLSLVDASGQNRAVLGVAHTVNETTGAETKTAENTLTLFNTEGRVLWRAPR